MILNFVQLNKKHKYQHQVLIAVFVFIIITYMNIIIANWIPDIVRESVLG